VRAREFIRELDINPIANQEYDRYGRQDIAGVDVSKKIGPGTASVQGMAMTSPDIDPTQINKNVSANYALPIGDGGISAGVTRTAGLPNNQFNVQGSVPVGRGNFSAGVSRTKDQPNNFNLGYSRQVGPGQLDVGINKQGQGGPAQGQIRYNMPFNEEDTRSQEFVAEYKKYPTADYEGVTFTMEEEDGFLTVKALNDFGISMASVIFGMDGRDLDPQSLRVDEKYRGQGIARVMYDYVKSRGFVIHRSWDQTDAGAGFWNKHRGEDVRVWEEEQLDELSFLGSECTKDCSGHRAGYDWSKRKGLRQANSWSPSFNKGAGLAVAGK
jgi:GNAT superfamily N-acetyltransferase